MLINTPNIRDMGRGFSKAFQRGFDRTIPQYDKLAMVVNSTGAEEVYGWMLELPRMRKWEGSRIIHNLKAVDHTIKNDDFELTVGVKRSAIEDDRLGVYALRMAAMGVQAKIYRDQLVADLLLNGDTATAYDGQFFFDTDHPDGKGGTYSNLQTAKPLTDANLESAWTAMTSLTGPDGQSLMAMPTTLVVGPLLKMTARKILTLQTLANGADNPYNGLVEVVVLPQLGTSLDWYLLDLQDELRGLVIQNRREAEFVNMTASNDENVFFRKEYVYGVDARAGAGYGLPFLAFKSKAA